jgi:hypothetical protein
MHGNLCKLCSSGYATADDFHAMNVIANRTVYKELFLNSNIEEEGHLLL